MKRKGIFFLLLSVTVGLSSLHAKTVVFGNALDYAGEQLKLKYYADEITQKEVILSDVKVDSLGNFSFLCNLKETKKCFIDLGTNRGILFVEPNKTYQIRLLPYVEKSESQKFDMFFRPKEILLSLVNPPKDDLNNQIVAFEDALDNAWNGFLATKMTKNAIFSAIDSLEKQFPSDNIFFDVYKKSNFAILANLCTDRGCSREAQSAFSSLKVVYNNPSYWEAFQILFDGYFDSFQDKIGGSALFSSYRSADYKTFAANFAKIAALQNMDLQELITVYNFSNRFATKKGEQKIIISLLKQMKEVTKNPENKRIVEDVLQKMYMAQPGTLPQKFDIIDLDGNPVSLDKFAGKYLYITFCSSKIEESKADMVYLEQLRQRYKDNLEVLFIFTYEDVATTKQYVKNIPMKSTIANWNNSLDLLKSFKVVNIPSYYLMDAEGRFMLSPAPGPEENFEHYFESLTKQEEESRNINNLN